MTDESVDIIEELSQNFIDSAYDTNTNRAFPDARDGLKPGQRCILWEMYKRGYSSKKPHVKSAKVDGGVAANWWPHGTSAIYETFVHMSQPFTNNHPEIDFHGANGNVVLGGDAFAADRYTEVRLAPIVEDGMLHGIEKDTVDMVLNFSEDEEMPTVLPAIFPRLLVNGSQGIGVSVANIWTLHNFQETANLLVEYLRTGEVDNESYYPDFPTGCTIVNQKDLPQINKTGKGKVLLEATYKITGKEIHFTEFPYQVYIEPVIEEIKKAYEDGRLDGFADCSNRTDKKTTLLVVEASSESKTQSLLESLFQYTSLRTQINVNQMAVVSKTPTLLTLKDMCRIYKEHNLSCIKREYVYEAKKTEERVEILEGLKKAYDDLDNIIRLIRESKSSADAKEYMIDHLSLIERQADAILALKLSRLAHLEKQEILSELQEKKEKLKELYEVIDSEEKQRDELIRRLVWLAANYGTTRLTKVVQKETIRTNRDKKEKIAEPVVICYTDNGYIKSVPAAKYREVDGNLGCIKTTTDDYIQIYNTNKVYRLKVDRIKQCLASEKGTALGTILGTGLTHIHYIAANNEDKDVIAVSRTGRIKKFNTSLFNGTTQNIKGQDYFPKNEVISIVETKTRYIGMNTADRKLTIDTSTLKASGKTSTGRVGIKLLDSESIKSVRILKDKDDYFGAIGTRGQKI